MREERFRSARGTRPPTAKAHIACRNLAIPKLPMAAAITASFCSMMSALTNTEA